jgi:hypothetical protein
MHERLARQRLSGEETRLAGRQFVIGVDRKSDVEAYFLAVAIAIVRSRRADSAHASLFDFPRQLIERFGYAPANLLGPEHTVLADKRPSLARHLHDIHMVLP